MGKFWSLLFAVVMGACAASFFVAPFVGWWLPEGLSTHAGNIDGLFYFILAVTGFFFFLTQALLCFFMFEYGAKEGVAKPERKKGVPKMLNAIRPLVSSPQRVELAWTFVPALILLWLAISQIQVWETVKYQSRRPGFDSDKVPVQIDVSARQFEWRFRYPSTARMQDWLKKKDRKDFESFARQPQADDVHVVNELHVWENHPALMHLTTKDVLHSFNLPHFRVKQDALPGKLIPLWFTASPGSSNTAQVGMTNTEQKEITEANRKFVYDIPCAELCGWGHYRMIGRVYVHKDQAEFLTWLKSAEDADHARAVAQAK